MKRTTRKNLRNIIITSTLASIVSLGILYFSSRDYNFNYSQDSNYVFHKDYSSTPIPITERDPKTGRLIEKDTEENYDSGCGRQK